MYLTLRLHLSTLIIRNVCYLRNFPRPSNAFIHFQGLRHSSGITGPPGLPGSCMRSASSNTTTPTVFCAPGKQGLKAMKGDNGSRWLPGHPGPRGNRGPRGKRGNKDPVGKRVTLGPQETLLIWNVSLSAPVGWIEVSGSRNIPRSIVIGENSHKSSVWKKAMLAGREDTNTLVVHLDWPMVLEKLSKWAEWRPK